MNNKIAFITGASSGLGKEIVRLLAENDYRVFAGVRNLEDISDLVQNYPLICPVCIDLTKIDQLDLAFQSIYEECSEKGLALLLNCAGYSFFSPIEFSKEKEARELFDVLFFAPFKLSQSFLPYLKHYYKRTQERPKVINIISWAAVNPGPWNAFYYAAKSALLSFSESQYYEFNKVNVDVVAILPGLMKTPFITTKSYAELQKGLSQLTHEGKYAYAKYFENLIKMTKQIKESSFLKDSKPIAKNIFKIIESKNPRFRYNLGLDSKFISFFTRILPFCFNSFIKKRMFGLNT
jgi:short-subunit dehydrogenase